MDTRSHLESDYPHIAMHLIESWHNPKAARAYLDDLATDHRDGRHGFPDAVFEELMFLHDLLWQLRHPDADHVDIYMDGFRFGVAPEQDAET
jgi:hypothetical protein